jgi:penicillin G amidase
VSVGMMEVQELDTHAANKLTRSWISTRLHNPQLEADLYPVGSWRDHPPTGVDVDLTKPQPAPPPVPDDNSAQSNPVHTSIAPTTSTLPPAQPPDSSLDPNTRQALQALGMNDCGGCAVGSNNWVIAGARTVSGKPLLANDMHIALTEPNIWYMAALRAPGFDAAGVTLPGVPFIIAGHNEHIAWGFTDLYADVQDLYVEQLDGKGNYLATGGNWKPLATDREVIHVRLGRNATVVVRSTDHGPLVNPILPKEKRPIALKWTLYDPSINDIPLYAMNTAVNWKEFSQALADWSWPTQNLVYSDDQGHIAYHAIGRVPVRPNGLVGVPITDNAHEWAGYIPFDDMPNALDPPSGFLATANSRVTTPQSPDPITLEWIDPYRIDRIYHLLDGRSHLAPRDMLTVQTDVYSDIDQEFAQRFAYAIDHTSIIDARLHQAADLMRGWDGQLAIDSAAPSIVDHARRALWPLLLKPKLGDLWTDYHWGESLFALEQIVMNTELRWLPPGYKDWNALLTQAVRQGLEDAKAPPNLARWNYGDWHLVDVENPLAHFLPYVGRIAGTGPQPMSGDTTTVKQVSPFIGPSQRFTMDWSNIDGSTENIVMGESSDPLSPYFRDQWDDWYNGATFSLPFSPAAVAAQTTHTLQLLP